MIHQQTTETITLNQQQLKYITNTQAIDTYERDIIPGQYEGGFKLWECTIDLLAYLEKHPELVQDKKVVEMGCGHGLVGILCKKMGSKSVCLQDYNKEVIEQLTVNSILVNGLEPHDFECISGDWSQLKSNIKYDIILGSELTYSK